MSVTEFINALKFSLSSVRRTDIRVVLLFGWQLLLCKRGTTAEPAWGRYVGHGERGRKSKNYKNKMFIESGLVGIKSNNVDASG